MTGDDTHQSSDIVQIPEDFLLSEVVHASTAYPIFFPGAANLPPPSPLTPLPFFLQA